MRLNQIRFRQGSATLDDDALRRLDAAERLVSGEARIAGGLAFSVDLEPARRRPRRLPRQAAHRAHRPRPHRPLPTPPTSGSGSPPHDRRIILDPGAFYILVSREAVHVPPDYAAEMAPYLAMVGEFRVHYAGFFDPGFGHAQAGGTGSRGVLEVRCHEAPFALDHGQIVGRLVYERMSERPEILYGRDTGSNYQGQGLKLSKHFRAG